MPLKKKKMHESSSNIIENGAVFKIKIRRIKGSPLASFQMTGRTISAAIFIIIFRKLTTQSKPLKAEYLSTTF